MQKLLAWKGYLGSRKLPRAARVARVARIYRVARIDRVARAARVARVARVVRVVRIPCFQRLYLKILPGPLMGLISNTVRRTHVLEIVSLLCIS